MEIREGLAPFRGYQTWYRITGDLNAAKPPLLVLHGGPGFTHDYLETLSDLALTGRAVVHYDQLGNGKSTHLLDKPMEFWTPELFIDELNNLTAHLALEKFDVFGQSWGGMLGAQFATTQPAGLRRLVIANSPADMATWVSEANRLCENLAPEVQEALTRHEAAGTTDSPEYEQAVNAFYAEHVCRIQPMPEEVARAFAIVAANPTVYHAMNGPSEFHVIGSIKAWRITDELHKIAVPTLLISGRHDEATLDCVSPYLYGIKDVRWHIFGDSSHLPHVEEKEACLAAVAAFLDA